MSLLRTWKKAAIIGILAAIGLITAGGNDAQACHKQTAYTCYTPCYTYCPPVCYYYTVYYYDCWRCCWVYYGSTYDYCTAVQWSNYLRCSCGFSTTICTTPYYCWPCGPYATAAAPAAATPHVMPAGQAAPAPAPAPVAPPAAAAVPKA